MNDNADLQDEKDYQYVRCRERYWLITCCNAYFLIILGLKTGCKLGMFVSACVRVSTIKIKWLKIASAKIKS